MKLAWQNIIHDRVRFLVTIIGVSFAAFLMVFQGSLLVGFLQASSKLIDASDVDIWITARGVPSFEFGAPVESRLQQMAAGVPGVTETSRVCVAFAVFRNPKGKQQIIGLVGADPDVGKHFPVPDLAGSADAVSPDAVLYDESNRAEVDVTSLPAEVEINRHRALMERQISGFGSFLGVTYLYTSYRNAALFLGFSPDESMYILVRVDPNYSVSQVQESLRRRLPEVNVLTRDEFARQSRWYWMVKTGAGGAVLIGALLGFLIGLVVVSQTVYANTMENIEEYATLKALGASRAFVTRIVVAQSLICGVLGSIVGLSAAVPLVGYARNLIAWIYTPWWLPVVMSVPSLAMCALASIASVRSALTVEPGRVFRA